MIKSFRHKGLKRFFQTGSTAGIRADHQKRLRLILGLLDAAKQLDDIAFPGSNLHPLKGDRAGEWSVTVNGNWRITFIFQDGDVHIVNYEDYH